MPKNHETHAGELLKKIRTDLDKSRPEFLLMLDKQSVVPHDFEGLWANRIRDLEEGRVKFKDLDLWSLCDAKIMVEGDDLYKAFQEAIEWDRVNVWSVPEVEEEETTPIPEITEEIPEVPEEETEEPLSPQLIRRLATLKRAITDLQKGIILTDANAETRYKGLRRQVRENDMTESISILHHKVNHLTQLVTVLLVVFLAVILITVVVMALPFVKPLLGL